MKGGGYKKEVKKNSQSYRNNIINISSKVKSKKQCVIANEFFYNTVLNKLAINLIYLWIVYAQLLS